MVATAAEALEAATQAGTAMVFGYLGGAPAPFAVTAPQHSFILAFRALPIVIVFAALSALLWHWRIIPLVISGLARLLASRPISFTRMSTGWRTRARPW